MERGQQFDPKSTDFNEGIEAPQGVPTMNNDVPWEGDHPQVKRLYKAQGLLRNTSDPSILGTFDKKISWAEAQNLHRAINPNGRIFDIGKRFTWTDEPVGIIGSGGPEAEGRLGVELGKEHLGAVPIPKENGHLIFSSEDMASSGEPVTAGGIIHEASHTSPGHGPDFATNYLRNVHQYIHPHAAAALEQHFIRNGIDYDPNWQEGLK